MNSYLSLVSEYAKVHKKKNRLTLLCIALSVMLITAIFGMADMSLKSQTEEAIRRYGNWHVIFSDISHDAAAEIAERKDVNVSSWLCMADGITYQGKELVVQSSNEELAGQMNLTVTEGYYPTAADEALLDRQGIEQFGLSIGGTIEVTFPDGKARRYRITGTFGDFSTLKAADSHGLLLSTEAMRALPADFYSEYYYVQFNSHVNINAAIADIKAAYDLNDEQIDTNVMLLGLMGHSDDTTMLGVYLTAMILFVLVAMAGVFMIASSFNMSVQERVQFFGLLRCLGATKSQVKSYIRREGLLHCVKAIPIGLLLGCAAQMAAMFVLNTINSRYIPVMPSYQISWLGVLVGTVLGFFVVMIASASPAKRAAKVSPQAAVTGNINQANNHTVTKASNTNLFRIDTAMGIRHAFSNKKSMALIVGSFATSIILFLCFSVFLTFMGHALGPLKPYTPDLTIEGVSKDVLLERELIPKIKTISGAEKVYGRMSLANISASVGETANAAVLISYDAPQFAWADDSLISGNIEDVQNGGAVIVDYGYAQETKWNSGDMITLTIEGKPCKVEVAGISSDMPIHSENGEWIIVCSESTFTSLTGIEDYTAIGIQISGDISGQVRELLAADTQLHDLVQRNNEVRTSYYAMAVFVYGFLIVIAFIALINIINTVGASVSSRMNNYGIMRAVGMSGRQLKKIITAESASYAVLGCTLGGIFGLLFHRLFYGILITPKWGSIWQPPFAVLAAIIFAALLTALVSVSHAAKQIEKMSIVNVVNAG